MTQAIIVYTNIITRVYYFVCMCCNNFSCKSQNHLVDLIGQSLRLELLVRHILPQILPIFLNVNSSTVHRNIAIKVMMFLPSFFRSTVYEVGVVLLRVCCSNAEGT